MDAEVGLIEELAGVGIDFNSLEERKKSQAVNQRTYLHAYAYSGTQASAANAAGITVQAVALWKQDDALGFNARFSKAVEAFADELENIAMDRIRNPEGRLGSDILLITMLNAHKPEKYRTGIVVVDETPKAVAAKLAKMAQEDKTERERAPAATRADNITAIEQMRNAHGLSERAKAGS